MRFRRRVVPSLLALTVGVLSLGVATAAEPDVVVVQHILIGFKKTIPGKELERTKKEARALADTLLARARDDEANFDSLVKEHTNDTYPGIFKLTNTKAALLPDSFERSSMALAFGDVAFRLEVGEVGLAKYNSISSPYGWHVIKRLE